MASKLHNFSTEQLLSKLEASIRKGVDALAEGCEIIGELEKRGEVIPLMTSGLYKWYKEINAGSLLPELVIKFAGADHILSRLVGAPKKEQLEYASTGKIKVAEMDRKGEIREVEKPIARLNIEKLDLVLENGKKKTFKQQVNHLQTAAITKPSKPITTSPSVRADTKAGVLIIGGRRVEPHTLFDAMAELGFTVTRTKKKKAA
ncbi:hypothetical protein PHIM7_244 [Sinorhizobium phage phiM7]|uniref:Uncharacterized protein n=2 Tax=Emdodecavirus TaxID=1980937 RepID=S5MBG8_9CAUD|nr:hypothetical protein AB690_gp263 [Sinorhizobium phage phiM12]YP_009601369.1 hypothetical protein FDH46_gp234 [Sinorhizobium phage phiM7]AGR47958.1 hypothetical protein SmphiM12_326 [Sinorhizobium phage phiM12]AKF12789.1 hypothetical protein PHIM7_244 [Sinorhizobium phage phiM7]AKF13150.1 hypothetical protein PHIM19_245 [Sinorhizobium phage phiM19]